MRVGQKLNNDKGQQVMLFPFEYMYISQGEGGSGSHAGTFCIDFLGWNANGRVYKCPFYAPCDCTCVAGATDYRIWQSDTPVLLADGSYNFCCWQCGHDDNPPAIGTKLKQGDLMGHTGTTGMVTGDHCHFNTALGLYDGWAGTTPNQLKNSTHIYNVCYDNDTVLVKDFDYPWVEFKGYIPPIPTIKKKKFPWVLYANKFRERNNQLN